MKETLTIYEKKTMGRNIATRVILISVAIVATICLCSFLIWAINNDDDYVISIIHMNDFHDRFDELTWSLANCKTQNGSCIGGFARLYSAIDKLKKELPNPIVLNAGDNFEGSLWYKIFKWNVTQYFLNLLPIDVITLGNHEFDDGIAGVVPFMKGLKAPIALANVDDSLEPSFQNLYTKSVILTRNNKKIGIIGVLTKETKFLASPERLIFTDEIEAVRTEAERLKHEEKCQIIIVLSHCGKNADREIAKFGGKYIHVIVGGHSHDLYYSGENPPGPDKVAASYPDIVLQANERKVLIVQSSWASKYLGHLTVYFTKNNEIDRWEGNSEFLDHNWPQNETINSLLTPWRDIIEEKAELVLGSTLTKLDQSDCFKGECTAGDFITDAILEEWKLKAETEDEWSYASVVIMNSGGIRSSIDEGQIFLSDLAAMFPFDDISVAFDIRGENLLKNLQQGVKVHKNYDEFIALQVHGLQLTINTSKSPEHWVQKVEVLCQKCKEPKYYPLMLNETYRVVTRNYSFNGGNEFTFSKFATNIKIGANIFTTLQSYVEKYSPLSFKKTGRITIVQ